MTRPRRGAPLPPIRLRLTILFAVMTLAFLGIGARLVELQARDQTHLQSLGVGQRVQTVTLPAERGSIFDRNGVDLALSVPQTTIVADPHVIHDPEGVRGQARARRGRERGRPRGQAVATEEPVRVRGAQGRRRHRGAGQEAAPERALLHPGGEALLPVGPARRAGARVRRHRRLRARRPRVVLREEPERPRGRGAHRARPAGQRDPGRRRRRQARRARDRHRAHDRPVDPGERRAHAHAAGRGRRGEGWHGDRRRRPHRRHPRDGHRRRRGRRAPRRTGAGDGAEQARDPDLRAGVDQQGHHDGRSDRGRRRRARRP